jgi:hypothetical protein
MDCGEAAAAGQWNYDPESGSVRYLETGKCLEITAQEDENATAALRMTDCAKAADSRQVFQFTKFRSGGLRYADLGGPSTKYGWN